MAELAEPLSAANETAKDSASERVRRAFFGIRARIIGLVCLTALPLLAVGAGFAVRHLDETKENAFDIVTTLARSGVTRLDDEIGNVSSLLLALSQSLSVERSDTGANDDLLARVYAEPEKHWGVYETCEELVDVEDNFQEWRFRHLQVVQRTIGHKTGTGGSSGVDFLRRALDLTFFPELYEVRTLV